MNSMTKVRKGGIALMVGALALSGVVGATAVANAVEAGPAVPAQYINTNQTGTIVIHKFANPSSGTNGNGLELTDATNPAKPTTAPVPGVTFTYQKVNEIDLTKNEGWVKASELRLTAAGELPTGYTAAAEAEFPATVADGSATKAGLSLGVYLIKEKTVPNSVVSQAKPFLVTVPFPNNDAKTKADKPWLYTVNVYPKNTVLTNEERPKKEVNDVDAVHFPGDDISWTITQKIPVLETNEQLKKYVFKDELPATVAPITSEDKITVEVTGADGAPIGAVPVKTVGQTVKVEFTGAELANLTAGATVKITLATKVVENPTGSIVNQSTTTMNDHDFISIPSSFDPAQDGDPDDPNNAKTKTTVDFGDLNIHKKNSADQALKDAEFKVAPIGADGTCGAVSPKDSNTSFKNVLSTDTDGNTSLKVKAGSYCVQETKAPLGYVLDETVHKVDVTAAKAGSLDLTNLKFNEDGKSFLPSLPVTGALGFVLLVLAGVMIIALAVGTGFVAVGRNKKRAE